MEQYNFFGFEVELDKAATQNWYARANEWGCTCGHCRNFLALAQKRNLPDAVLAPLQMLGIPPEKATYVCQLYPDGDGQCYQFSYRIVGRILSEREAEELPYNWGDGRCGHEPYPYGAPGFSEPHFDLEFYLTLPWVLEEPTEG